MSNEHEPELMPADFVPPTQPGVNVTRALELARANPGRHVRLRKYANSASASASRNRFERLHPYPYEWINSESTVYVIFHEDPAGRDPVVRTADVPPTVVNHTVHTHQPSGFERGRS